MRKKHLIIGAGPAALSALEAIRHVTSQDEVKLVTLEDCLPYSPAALPYLLLGRLTEAQDEGIIGLQPDHLCGLCGWIIFPGRRDGWVRAEKR